ncbi:PREDICTED: tumor necrosis factor receptor superfamily member 16 [Ceratotherium simum simum]|uniref:Tumor necrosis factor receptor superfamily member 16 n=1 Tax=Ceratotherium simum simum TaxID=73337 RepID=A0ABM1D3B2_CERSS|nr:PREDICTED: tumor necrosis factor receptor superfamily member 16 [Ceratotherium simum simum]
MGAGAAGCAMDGPRLRLLLLLLGVRLLGGAKEVCPTDLYTHSGECCKACNLGEGVAQPCGANQTVCEPCLDSVTFSDVVSATEPCKPCTECVGLQSMSAPCVEADDAVCRCAYGYYQDETTGRCEACRVCEAGSGLVFSCQDKQNTVCEECPDGTYSDEANHVDPCLPCTVCEDTERQLRECTRWADAECEEIPSRWITRATPPEGSDSTVPSTEEPEGPPEQDLIASTVADVVTTVMGSSQPVVTRGTADNLIPVYCSILAAVVVGLVAYIAFKRWNSCKQNKQGANSRPVNQTPPPEGEKLHSDSGISVDSQSLHDQQPHTQTAAGQALKGDGGLYSSLPLAKREEVEKLLNGSAGDTWRHLAGELGYQPEHIDSFTHEACPVRALLASWAAQDSATLDALLAALRRIQRADIVESLCSESTATSPV